MSISIARFGILIPKLYEMKSGASQNYLQIKLICNCTMFPNSSLKMKLKSRDVFNTDFDGLIILYDLID